MRSPVQSRVSLLKRRKLKDSLRFLFCIPARHGGGKVGSPAKVWGLAIYNQCSFYLFVGYSVAVLSINLLSYIRFVVVLSSSFGCQKKQKPRHAERSVWLFFVQESKMSFSLRALVTWTCLLVFGWCGTPSVSHSPSERLTNSKTVLPLNPKTKRVQAVTFNGAGF